MRLRPLIPLLFLLAAASCGRGLRVPEWKSFDGDPRMGAKVIEQSGCGQCHEIDGIPGAVGTIGPPLTRFAVRTTIAGILPNTPENLIRWIRDPQAFRPGDVMPDMDLSERQARDAAAYLHSLK